MSTPLSEPLAYETALASLAAEVGTAKVRGNGAVRVRGVRQDSRAVRPGDLFVARKGEKVDGLAFLQAAADAGAAAILAQEDHPPPESFSLPVLLVPNLNVALSKVASMVYGHPGRALEVIGITGTNGKTTTTYLVQAALESLGKKTAVLGTLGAHFGSLTIPSPHTTPQADELIRTAAHLRAAGATHLAIEVSSHALEQHRADALRYRVAAFTNFTRDHLDFHGTMEAYFQAKARLFQDLAPESAALVVDDSYGLELATRVKCPVVRISKNPAAQADIKPCSAVEQDLQGIRCQVATPRGKVYLKSPLLGEHNLSNLLLTLGVVAALGLPMDGAAQSFAASIVVPGRLERCDGPEDDLRVVVDYSHSPDSLERALSSLRPLTASRLYCVFGCGGDRDRTKRPLMGDIAGRLADVAILTNDNPRSEPPEQILNAVLEGLRGKSAEVVVEPDRAQAIDLAIQEAKPGDVVLLAGKGHETYQILGSATRHFDDREEARKALAKRRARRGGAAE